MQTYDNRIADSGQQGPPEGLRSDPWSRTGSAMESDQALSCGSWKQLQPCPSYRLLVPDV